MPEKLTFGQELTGVLFNPSKNADVDKAKQLFADAADILQDARNKRGALTELEDMIYKHSIGNILSAQMGVVKFLTYKPE